MRFATWRLVSKGVASDAENVNTEFAKLVLLSIAQPPLLLADLKRHTVGTDGQDSDSSFRQVKSRTQRAIRAAIADHSCRRLEYVAERLLYLRLEPQPVKP